MKKYLLLFLLAFGAVSSFASDYKIQYAYDDDSNEEQQPAVSKKQTRSEDLKHRNSFFLRATSGYISDDIDSFEGDGPNIDLEMGFNIHRIVAIYGGLDAAYGTGSITGYSDDYDASFFYINGNLGVLITPFRSVPILRGTLFGLEVGLGGESVFLTESDDDDVYVDDAAVFFKFELGYTWGVSRRIDLGVVFYVTAKEFLSTDSDYEYDYEPEDGVTIGLAFTIMRR